MIKNILKKIRNIVLINTLIRTPVRFFYHSGQKLFAFFSVHWPVTGVIPFRLPNGKQVKIYSRADDFVSTQAYWKGYDGYEGPSVRMYYHLALKSNTIVDIGANVGYFTLIGAHANNKASVYAFEPVPNIYERLQKNIVLNGLKNVKAINSVAGDSEQPVKFYVPIADTLPLAGSTKKGWAEDAKEIDVPSTTLDAFKTREQAGKIDLIKMDCEFHEVEVLNGMKDILANDKPLILMEVLFPEAEGIKGHFENNNYLEIERIMKDSGYYFYLISQNALVRLDKLEYNADERNYLFAPRKSNNIYLSFSEMDVLLKNIL